jgi:hypothetical protein
MWTLPDRGVIGALPVPDRCGDLGRREVVKPITGRLRAPRTPCGQTTESACDRPRFGGFGATSGGSADRDAVSSTCEFGEFDISFMPSGTDGYEDLVRTALMTTGLGLPI